jgi:hypothetical protein
VKHWLGTLLQVALALAAGLGSAWWLLTRGSTFGEAAGPWRVSLVAGSADADLYTRSRVAIGGLLALNRQETMYYLASTDSAGAPLRSRCSYRVTGLPPRARWWSVTAYTEDYFLFPNDARRYSVNGATAPLDAGGRFSFVSAPQQPVSAASDGGESLWLPTPGDRGLLFTLRVYNPAPELTAAPASLDAPSIEPLGKC